VVAVPRSSNARDVYVLFGRGDGGVATDEINCYFSDTDTWTEALKTTGQKPARRSGALAFSPHRDWIVAYGGRSDEANASDAVHALHLPSLVWHDITEDIDARAAPPRARTDFAHCAVDGASVFIVGGESTDDDDDVLGDMHLLRAQLTAKGEAPPLSPAPER